MEYYTAAIFAALIVFLYKRIVVIYGILYDGLIHHNSFNSHCGINLHYIIIQCEKHISHIVRDLDYFLFKFNLNKHFGVFILQPNTMG